MIYFENILICIALPLIVMVLFLPEKSRRLFVGFVIGMVVCLFGAYINDYFSNLYHMDTTDTARYISPIVEEIMKVIPIVLYTLLFLPEREDLMGFSVAIGAGFATFENCCYITQNGSQLFRFVLFRGLAVGVMHVVCGLVIGMSISIARRYKFIMIPEILGAFSLAATIHALYNLLVSVEGVTTIIGFFTPIIVLGLLYFLRPEKKDIQ